MNKLDKVEKKLNKVEEKFEENTLAIEMLRELKNNCKRWFIAFIVVLLLWFITIGMFIWYINQPIDEIETIEYSQEGDTDGDNSSINQKIGE